MNETTPHLHCDFVPLLAESIGEDVMGDKEMRRTQEKFLEAMQEEVPRAKYNLEPEKAQFNGLDQKLYER